MATKNLSCVMGKASLLLGKDVTVKKFIYDKAKNVDSGKIGADYMYKK